MKEIFRKIFASILILGTLSFATPAAAVVCLVQSGCTGVGTITGIPYGTGTSPLGIVTIGSGVHFAGGVLTATGSGGTLTSIGSVDGSITITSPTTTPDLSVVKSPKLSTGRTIGITGDLTYTSPSFDGSGNVTGAGTLATVNGNVGTFGSATQAPQITLNGKGLATAASNITITPAVGSITGLGTGIATWLATPSSANLATAMTDETGSGSLVFASSPTLVTPILGAATATTINKLTITTPAVGSTLTIADGKTLTDSNTLTFTGTDGSSVNFGAGGTVLYGNQSLTLSGDVTGSGSTAITTTVAKIAGTTVSGTTGSGNVVFSTSPTLVTPALGTPSSLVGTNITGTASGLTAGNVTTNANLTGAITSVGNATSLGSFSSANLLSALSTSTGSGVAVFGTTPTLATPVINGLPTGTGVASAATASTLVSRDANANITANNWLGGYSTTATAAGTTTLTVGSTYLQYFTGATTQIVALPVVSTLALGTQYVIVNNSTGAVTVNSSGGNAVIVLAGGTSAVLTSIATSGTGASVWSSSYAGTSTATGKVAAFSNTLTFAGTDGTTMTFPTTSATIARTDASNTFTGHQTIEGVTSTGATGTGKFVFDGSPTLVTPNIGAATASGLTLSGITGSTQCLHVNTSGVVSGTGSDCGGAGAATITIGSTAIVSGTNTRVLYDNSGIVGEMTTSGSGTQLALTNTPTITTPVLTGLPTGSGVAAAATASTLVARDANANETSNDFIKGWTTTATAGATTTLTIASTPLQYFTGSSAQTVKLPTTSVATGQQFQIVNNSTGLVTVQSSGANTITILGASTSGIFTAVVATPTTAANWNGTYAGVNAASGKVGTISNTLTFAGTDGTTMTFPTTSATIARTDAANTFTGHQTIEGVTSTGATGTGNLVFDTAPTFSSTVNAVTGYQINGAASSRKILVGNGTNFVASTETFATPGTSGNVMTSDGTNWTSAASTGYTSVTVNISSSDILNLASTPKTLIAAQGANTIIQIDEVAFSFTAGTQYSGGGACRIAYNGATTNNITADLPQANITSATNTVMVTPGSNQATAISGVNTAVTLVNIGAAFTGGTGTLKAFITYRVISL